MKLSIAVALATFLGLVTLAGTASAETTPNYETVMVQRCTSDFPGECISLARPRFPKKPAATPAPKRIVDLKAAAAETASLNQGRRKVVEAYRQAKVRFAQIYSFTGVEITKATCAEAEAKAWTYFGTLPQEVQDAYGGAPPTVICQGSR